VSESRVVTRKRKVKSCAKNGYWKIPPDKKELQEENIASTRLGKKK